MESRSNRLSQKKYALRTEFADGWSAAGLKTGHYIFGAHCSSENAEGGWAAVEEEAAAGGEAAAFGFAGSGESSRAATCL
jgi:hypothetical protein